MDETGATRRKDRSPSNFPEDFVNKAQFVLTALLIALLIGVAGSGIALVVSYFLTGMATSGG